MKEIPLEESKKIMIDILESIDRCCRANNLKYSLCWGTMIGAVRHHGFIPWDDDIDITMPRDDYNRFLRVYNDPNYNVYTPKVDKNCIQIITKIYDKRTRIIFNNHPKTLYGVWISIFPYDNVPDENLRQWEKRLSFWTLLYQGKAARFLTTNPIKKRIGKVFLKIVLLPFSSFWLYNRVERCLTEYNGSQTKRVAITTGIGIFKFLYFSKEWFDECIDIEFEGVKTKIIKGYDQFLKHRYGDYMELPPESERIPKHKYKAYYI